MNNLFRVFDKLNKQYLKIFAIDNDGYVLTMDYCGYDYLEWSSVGNHYIIERNTGLKDKNNKEIFEGDYLLWNNINYLCLYDGGTARFIIENLKNKSFFDYFDYDNNLKMEIIGQKLLDFKNNKP